MDPNDWRWKLSGEIVGEIWRVEGSIVRFDAQRTLTMTCDGALSGWVVELPGNESRSDQVEQALVGTGAGEQETDAASVA